MKKLGARGQKVLKIFHLIMASMWLGGALGLIFMNLFLDGPASGQELYGYDLARKFVDDYLVIPGAMGCLFTGLFISLWTGWGFFRHTWVTVKWILTVTCILVGTFFLGPLVNGQPEIAHDLGLAALHDPVYQHNLFFNTTIGALQIISLLFMTVISVIKPWRKKNQERIANGQ